MRFATLDMVLLLASVAAAAVAPSLNVRDECDDCKADCEERSKSQDAIDAWSRCASVVARLKEAFAVRAHRRCKLKSPNSLRNTARKAKWDKQAMHNALKETTVVFRIFRERAAALRPSLEEQNVMMRRGPANLVTRFNVDTMVHGPWVRLGFSNPRDTIYALRGLVSNGDPVSEHLVTDYNLPATTIFTDFTRLLFDVSIGTTAIVTLLLSQMETKRIHGLPSWVPD
ncbi:hypothetical protein DL768_004143 [Monosporascus sp. mg162]|nr:hypothetical protein DL768_004143 [Monosporascus sp. mg162]